MTEITDPQALADCLNASKEAPVLIFKHSTACPISWSAHKEVDRFLSAPPENAPPIYWIDVIKSRPLSRQLAETVGVEHQSPQLLLLRDAHSAWTASHGKITADNIQDALNKHL